MAKKKFLMDEDEMDAILDSDIAALDQGHSDQKILDIVRAGGQGLTAAQDFYEIPVDQIDPFRSKAHRIFPAGRRRKCRTLCQHSGSTAAVLNPSSSGRSKAVTGLS